MNNEFLHDVYKGFLIGFILAFVGILGILAGIKYFIDGKILLSAFLITVGYILLTFRVKYTYQVYFDTSNSEDDED